MLGQSGISEYFDGMIEHDGQVGQILKVLDDLGIANDTIVVYSTDNGPHMNTWPDGGYTPFGNENTRTGKAHSACRRSCAGRASRRARLRGDPKIGAVGVEGLSRSLRAEAEAA
jgi:Sulfatase